MPQGSQVLVVEFKKYLFAQPQTPFFRVLFKLGSQRVHKLGPSHRIQN